MQSPKEVCSSPRGVGWGGVAWESRLAHVCTLGPGRHVERSAESPGWQVCGFPPPALPAQHPQQASLLLGREIGWIWALPSALSASPGTSASTRLLRVFVLVRNFQLASLLYLGASPAPAPGGPPVPAPPTWASGPTSVPVSPERPTLKRQETVGWETRAEACTP